jgi:mono/diheme cytochrome c family protein
VKRPGLPATLLALSVTGSGTAVAAAPANPVFETYCALCHQVGATGLPGQFPRLAGRVGQIATDVDGRRYLISVVLNGMAGRITVDGTPLVGVMPPFTQLSDADIASVLSYLSGLGTPRHVIKAADVAGVRAAGSQSASQVLATRTALADQGHIP